MYCIILWRQTLFSQVTQNESGHFECYPLLCCLLKASRFASHCLYKLKAVLNADPAQLMRGSLQNLHEMMLSNGWHKNVACNPPAQTLGVNMPAPPFSQRLLPVQTIALPLPEKHNDSSAIFSSRCLGCLRPIKQPGTALIISFIHIVVRHLSLRLYFCGLKLVPLTHFVPSVLRILGVMISELLLFACIDVCLSTLELDTCCWLKQKRSFI